MSAAELIADPVRRPELVWVGSGAWVACDPDVGPNDPHRVVAYLECKDGRVYLLWAGASSSVREFASLRDALDAVTQRLPSSSPR